MIKYTAWKIVDGELYKLVGRRQGFSSARQAVLDWRYKGYKTIKKYNEMDCKYDILATIPER